MKTYDERMAAVQQKLQKKHGQHRMIVVAVGMLCLCIVAGTFLFLRYNEPEKATYDKAMLAVKEYLENPPEHDPIYSTPDTGGSVNQPSTPVEITDNQVAGVQEGDLIKRTQSHIFYVRPNGSLRVCSIAGEQTKQVLGLKKKTLSHEYDSFRIKEIYLSEDGTRLIMVGSGYDYDTQVGNYMQITSLDVSDPENVKELGNIYINAIHLPCRMVGDRLIVFGLYQMNKRKADPNDPTTYLPQMGVPGNAQCIPAEDVIVPEKLTSEWSTIAALLNINDLSVVDTAAFMSYGGPVFSVAAVPYVSKERIYVKNLYTFEEKIANDATIRRNMTELSCLSYNEDGFKYQGKFSVEGEVTLVYNMDEYNGVFRVVTETIGATFQSSGITDRFHNATLTCFKVGTWEQLAQVKNFAPEGETVESVRFNGNYAYVCTAVVVNLTDPVFFFDMTDLNNIIVKDTGAIEGYSSSLVQLENGFLMGIGFDDARNLKVEIYEETTTGVQGVCEYILQGSFATKYKAYYIDRENNMFGIPTDQGYVLLLFDGYELRELARVFCGKTGLNSVRGVVIEDYLYIFGDGFAVQKIR